MPDSRHYTQCVICNRGQEVDWGDRNTEIAEVLGTTEASVRRHKAFCDANDLPYDWTPEKAVYGVKTTDSDPTGRWVPRRRWETASGEERRSWTFQPNAADIPPVGPEYLEGLLASLRTTGVVTPRSTNTELFLYSDPQVGKAGEAGGGTPELIARTRESVDRAVQRYLESRPYEIVFVDLGDPIENCFSTPGQVVSNDLTLPDQITTYRRIVLEILARFAPLCQRLVYVTVTSNHGEVRTGLKTAPFGSEADWGLHIQESIRDALVDTDLVVEFIRPPTGKDTSELTTYDGSKVAFTHGHHSSNPSKMKEWVRNQIVGRQPGWDATLWFSGHYHHFSADTLGNGISWIGCPAMDGGSEWFTKKTGDVSPSGVVVTSVSNGKWSDLSIL